MYLTPSEMKANLRVARMEWLRLIIQCFILLMLAFMLVYTFTYPRLKPYEAGCWAGMIYKGFHDAYTKPIPKEVP